MSTKYDNKIAEVRGLITSLLESIVSANQISLDAFNTGNLDAYKTVQEKLNNIEAQGDMIDNEIIKTFALFGPEAKELRSLVAYLKMNNELISIGSGIRKYSRRMKECVSPVKALESLKPTISQLHKSTVKALELILECFKNFDDCNIDDDYRKIMIEESKNDDIFSILEKEIMSLIIDERELSPEYVKLLGTIRKLERSCDRSVNIANLMMYAKKGGDISLYNN